MSNLQIERNIDFCQQNNHDQIDISHFWTKWKENLLFHLSDNSRHVMLCASIYCYQWDSLKSLPKMSVFKLFWPYWVFVNSLTFNGIISYGLWAMTLPSIINAHTHTPSLSHSLSRRRLYLMTTKQNQRKLICLLWFWWEWWWYRRT